MDTIEYNRLRRAVDVTIKSRIGEDKNISGVELTKLLRSNGFANHKPDQLHREIRNIIRDMRKEGIPICSKASKGYFWPATYAEVLECAAELEDKAKDMMHTAKGLKDSGQKVFKVNPQMDLFGGEK